MTDKELKAPKMELTIQFGEEPPVVFQDQDLMRFNWGVGASGDLMIFRVVYHPTFLTPMQSSDAYIRYRVYPHGSWTQVGYEELEE